MIDATDRQYVIGKFRGPTADPATGLDNDALKAGVLALADELDGLPHPVVKARAFAYLAENVRIDVSPHDWFVGFGCWNRNDRPLAPLLDRWRQEVYRTRVKTAELQDRICRAGAVSMWPDFDHSVPDWDAVFALGFPGLRERARAARAAHGDLMPVEAAYFDGIEITYTAILGLLDRLHRHALAPGDFCPRVAAVADCLAALRDGAPRNTYDVLQLIYLFFVFSEHLDHMQVRSLGNLDRVLYPWYRRDLDTGCFTEAKVRELFDHFLLQWASINNYWGHPFYLGGTAADGSSEVNELSHLILEEFEYLDVTSPKIQLKIAPNTPVDFLDRALNMVRRHNSSLVFVSEVGIGRAMAGLGFSAEEARTCDINGCYEYDVRAREVKTAPIYLNFVKPVEFVLHNGMDPRTGLACGCATGDLDALATFDAFYHAYLRQLDTVLDVAFRCADGFEPYLQDINPANVFSATIEHSLKVARDAFANGSVYNNTIVLTTGLATAADALAVVKQFVFERRELTLPRLRDILAADWEGAESLRLKIIRENRAFGNGKAEVDALATAIAEHAAGRINRRPNVRGGFYKAGMHSARMFIVLGEKTGATPDGRRAGEEISKNISPTMGRDVQGVTAVLNSVARVDSALFPADYALDLMLHPTTVRGREGLAAMRHLVRAYMDRGGASVQFNVFSADVLREAQQHPERYRNLQVRICGWNARFVDLCRQEQDAYIARAENIAD